MRLVIFGGVLSLVLGALVYHARRRYGRMTREASAVDQTRPASLRELMPALAHAGVLELAVTCAALLIVTALVLVLQALV